MKVTILGSGTSHGVPVIGCDCNICTSNDVRDNRTRCSVLIETETTSIVIDTGPDFRHQMLKEKVKKLDAVLFTHEHKDHTAGLDDIRAFSYQHPNGEMPVYADKRVQENLRQSFAYIFTIKKYPGVPGIIFNDIKANEPFMIGDLKIQPLEVMHHLLPVMGFRINDFVYITDVNYISEESYAIIDGCRILVLSALQIEKHISHFKLSQSIEVAQKIKAEKTYFTHISHNLGLHRDVEEDLLPDSIYLAYDGLQIYL